MPDPSTKNSDDAPTPTTPPPQAPAASGKTKRKPRTRRPKPRPLPAWHVVLLDDDDHTYEYVIEMLGRVFRCPQQTAYRHALAVDTEGRVIVFTSHKELAELKRDQILAYGADPRIGECKGSMTAIIEPAR